MRLSLFGTKPLADAEAHYAAVVAEARLPAWYRDAGVPDTLDGRFAVLATLLALTDIRLERGGDHARSFGPRLTEAFIADGAKISLTGNTAQSLRVNSDHTTTLWGVAGSFAGAFDDIAFVAGSSIVLRGSNLIAYSPGFRREGEYALASAFAVASLLTMLAIVTLVIKTFIEWRGDGGSH